LHVFFNGVVFQRGFRVTVKSCLKGKSGREEKGRKVGSRVAFVCFLLLFGVGFLVGLGSFMCVCLSVLVVSLSSSALRRCISLSTGVEMITERGKEKERRWKQDKTFRTRRWGRRGSRR
jgi:hypothetical protein